MTDPILKLQILARSEMSLLRIQTRRNISRWVLWLVALVFTLLALGMFNFAGYQLLVESRTPAMAATWVAITDCILAVGMVVYSSSVGTNAEQEKMIRDIRDLAYNELRADFDEVKAGFEDVSDDIRRIRSGFNAFSNNTTSLSNGLAPILNLLISTLKKSRNK
ncbi:MAG: hypothetical protein ACN4GM_12040 [Gammaproteobacteria bacterium]